MRWVGPEGATSGVAGGRDAAGERRGLGRERRACLLFDRPSAPGLVASSRPRPGGPARKRPQRLTLALALAAAAVAAPLSAQQLATVTVPLRSAAAVDSLRRLGVDVVSWRFDPARGPGAALATAVVSGETQARLAARGWSAVPLLRAPLPAAMEARRTALGPAAFTVYRDFDDPVRGVAAYLRAFAAARANVEVDSIGASWEGRPLLAVKVGPAGDDAARPNVVFLATYHAREWAATEMALRLIRFLADSMGTRPGGAALLAGRDVWVIPVVNPDGYEYTFTTDRLWRKNRRANAGGSFGVDLNRNHAAFFAYDNAGSSGTPAYETYRGPSAESEPETRAIVAFHRAHPPDVAISYHTYGDDILYPWGHADGLFSGDQAAFVALAGTPLQPAVLDSGAGSSKTRYTPAPGWQLYPTNGDYTEWAYQALGTLAYTVEITPGCCLAGGDYYGFEFPDDEVALDRVFRDNLPFALALLAAAGPSAAVADTSFVSVWPSAVVTAPAATGALTLEYATGAGAPHSVALHRDPLGEGRFGARYVGDDAPLAGAAAARVASLGLGAAVVAREGAEWPGTPWRGFTQVKDQAIEGSSSYYGLNDGLVSPAFAVRGRTGLRLSFWTRHQASLDDSGAVGRVEISTDHGTSWTEVWRVVGEGTVWYPVSVPLAVAGADSVQLRFRSALMPWWIDAIAVTADDTVLAAAGAAAQGNPLTVNANPVRTAPLVVRWPAATGNARAQVFTYAGGLVADETLAGDPGLWRWDLTPRTGGTLANGAYIVVVTRGDGVRYRRRVFILRSGS